MGSLFSQVLCIMSFMHADIFHWTTQSINLRTSLGCLEAIESYAFP
jgi:hypothetical protein